MRIHVLFTLIVFCIGFLPFLQTQAMAGDAEQVSKFLAELELEDPEVRRQAAYQLGELGIAAIAAVEPLAKASDERVQEVRWYAVEALGKIGPAAKAAVPMIVAGFNDELNDRFFRRSAIRSLGQIGEENEEVTAAIEKALASEDVVLQVEATVAKFVLDKGETNSDKLTQLLMGDELLSSRAVCWHLGSTLSDQLPTFNTTLCELATSEDANLATAARWALSQRGYDAGDEILKHAAEAEGTKQSAYLTVLRQWIETTRSDAVAVDPEAMEPEVREPEERKRWTEFVATKLVLHHLKLANKTSQRAELAENLALTSFAAVAPLKNAFTTANPAQRVLIATTLYRIADKDMATQPQVDQVPATNAVHAWLSDSELNDIPPAVWKLAAKLPTEPLAGEILRQGLASPNAVVRRYAAELLRRQQ